MIKVRITGSFLERTVKLQVLSDEVDVVNTMGSYRGMAIIATQHVSAKSRSGKTSITAAVKLAREVKADAVEIDLT